MIYVYIYHYINIYIYACVFLYVYVKENSDKCDSRRGRSEKEVRVKNEE